MKRLKEFLNEQPRGYKAKLKRDLGISHHSFWQIMNNKVETKFVTIKKLADYTGLPLEAFETEENQNGVEQKL